MTARLYVKVFAPDDLPTEDAHLTSKSLGTVNAATELEFKKHHHGTDSFRLRINRHHPQADLLLRDRYVVVYSDIGPVGGAFLEEAPVDLSAEQGTGDEWMTWTGRGSVAILQNGTMDATSNITGGEDPIDGYWDLSAQGSLAGNENGHPIPMMKRVLNELDLNAPNGIAIVDHSSWDYDADSDAATPPDWGRTGWGVDIGDDALKIAGQMAQLGGITWDMSHLFVFNAHLVFGTDRSGDFGAAGKVRFEKGVNIAAAVQRKVRGAVTRTHLIVGGAESTYVTVVDPDYVSGDVVRWGFLAVPETSDEDALEEAGLAHIELRKRQTDAWSFPAHDHGDDIANGIYEPGRPGTSGAHYWVGDRVSLHTGTGEYDADEEVAPVAAITWQLKTGDEANGDYWVIPEVGSTFHWDPDGVNSQGVAGSQRRILFCPPIPDCHDLTVGQMEDATDTNGDVESGATNWSGGGTTTSRKHGGTTAYEATGSSVALEYDFGVQVFEAGVRYVLDIWRRIETDHDVTTIYFGVDGGDEESTVYQGIPGDDPVDLWDQSETGADGGTWQRGRVCWTPSAERTGVRVRFESTAFTSGWHAVDDLALYTASDALTGTSNRAARCDHGHWAREIGFRNGGTGLDSTNVQDAIAELAELIDDDSTLPWVNVLDHGADPTGVSDSWQAFDDALETRTERSAALIVPPGVYRMSAPLVLGNSTVILGVGANMENQVSGMDTLTYRPHSVLYFDNDTDGIISPDDAAVTYRCHHPVVENITIRGGGLAEGNRGVWMRDNASSSVAIQRVGLAEFRNCFVEYWDTAYDFDGTADSCKVIGGHIHDCDAGFVGGLSEDVFERVVVWDLATGPAVSISGDRGQVIGCEIEPQVGSGIVVSGDFNRVVANDVKDVTGTAITVSGADNTITANTASRSIGTYYADTGTDNVWAANTPTDEFPAGGSVAELDDLSDVAISSPEANQQLQYVGGTWVNNHRRWEPVVTDPGGGPELVFDGSGDIVMTWADYS